MYWGSSAYEKKLDSEKKSSKIPKVNPKDE